ncbi:MAG: DUF6289 family protein [Thermoanaerobaculia bacterium]
MALVSRSATEYRQRKTDSRREDHVKSQRSTALLVVLLFLSGLGIAQVALGLPPYGGAADFYSDDTYTDLVGGWSYTCIGAPDQWGTTTSYAIVYGDFPCNPADSPCPNGGCWSNALHKLYCCP